MLVLPKPRSGSERKNGSLLWVKYGSGTPRPKTISARDSSARTFRPIFQSGTARPTLVGPLGPFFYFYFIFSGGGGRGGGGAGAGQFIILFCLCASKKN